MIKNYENVVTSIRNILSPDLRANEITDAEVEKLTQDFLNGNYTTTETDTDWKSFVFPHLDVIFNRIVSEEEAHEKQAETIIIKLNGKPYETYIDIQGVQRFRPNRVIQSILNKQLEINGDYLLNVLNYEYLTGKYSPEEWLDFYTSSGYSVDGLLSLSAFVYLTVEEEPTPKRSFGVIVAPGTPKPVVDYSDPAEVDKLWEEAREAAKEERENRNKG